METKRCARCKKEMENYEFLKAQLEQKLKPSEIDDVYCHICLPIIKQKIKLEKAREEIKNSHKIKNL